MKFVQKMYSLFVWYILKTGKSWGQLPSLLLKIEGGGEIVLPPFLALNLRKKNFFYYSKEAYIVYTSL
jgi:hypothetical protein